MSINRKAIGIWGAVLLGSTALAAALGGCDEVPPSRVAKPECNGAAFMIKMHPNYTNCPQQSDLPKYPPEQGHWNVEALCGGGPELPVNLQGVCKITWVDGKGSSKGAPDTSDLLRVPGIAAIEEDCLVTAPQALSDAAGTEMNTIFRKAADVDFDASKLQAVPFPGPSFSAVVDTLPFSKVAGLFGDAAAFPSESPNSILADSFPFGKEEHGWLVLALIGDLTTYQIDPGATVPTGLSKLDAQVALPNIDYDHIDMENGGFSGRLFHLTEAICKVVEDWKTWSSSDPANAPAPVIAMPLGALPVEGQKCSSEADIKASSLPTQLVYYALQHAACHGAAIIAAAGNDANGPDTVQKCSEVNGPLCPGAMSNIAAPTPDECSAMYKKDANYDPSLYRVYNPPATNPLKNPLVHMISAVDPSGTLLPTTRVGSRSRLAAIGAQGLAKDMDGEWHDARSGTSIATAVAAAAFATLFAYDRMMTPAEAADVIYNSALDTNSDPTNPVQVADDGSGDVVKMISICRALEQSLQMKGELEGQLGCATKVDTNASTIVANGEIYTSLSLPPLPIVLNAIPPENGASPSTSECSGDTPGNNPQPGSHHCNDCGYLVDDHQAVIRFHNGNQVALSQLTLILQKKVKGLKEQDEVFTLPNFGFAPGSSLVLNVLSTIPPENLRSVTFEAIVEGDGYTAAVSGAIPIYKKP